MTGAELTFVEHRGRGRSSSDNHLSVVLAPNGRPILTADVELAAALTRAVMEAAA